MKYLNIFIFYSLTSVNGFHVASYYLAVWGDQAYVNQPGQGTDCEYPGFINCVSSFVVVILLMWYANIYTGGLFSFM